MRRFWQLFSLILAGELIFALPFHVARFFRPTLLNSLEISNAELGDAFAAYGVVAMLSYFPGGLLADRFSPRVLMVTALLATAAGGLVLAGKPAGAVLLWLFAYWGATTIALFWAAMIKATRGWGDEQGQGRAFGVLDGGRGLAAAVLASAATGLLGIWLGAGEGLPGQVLAEAERDAALRAVVFYYTACTVGAAALVAWAWRGEAPTAGPSRATLGEALRLLRSPAIALQALVVVCAYCGYKAIDNYGLLLTATGAYDELAAARFMAALAFARPLAAVVTGLLADRFGAGTTVTVSFVLLALGYGALALGTPHAFAGLLLANLVGTALAVFAVRAIYFALLAESGVARRHTGTAAGIVSVVGFTPDIFFAPVTGRVLDAWPGLAGHQWVFAGMVAVTLIGAGCALLLRRRAGSVSASGDRRASRG